jgi:hypothetical protein
LTGIRSVSACLIATLLLAACGPPPVPTVIPRPEPATPTMTPGLVLTTPTVASFFRSSGGGDPRTGTYWRQWNACAPDNRADIAAANGGREEGWIILDDLLLDPGILLGQLHVESCQQGINLLDTLDLDGQRRSGDPVYELAQSLLVAQLNLAAGAEYCPAVDEAVRTGQQLLLSLGFDGRGEYSEALQGQELGETAAFLVEQLGAYNLGALCR